MSYVVGLTGGIGSGKSEVAKAFVALGADMVDADEAAHALSAPGHAGHRAVVAAFGPRATAPDGTLDRGWLREAVFADPAQRRRLESILHPLIRACMDEAMAKWTAPYGILSVPLLLERNARPRQVARVLVVDCPEELQVQRVMARSGLTAPEVRAIMDAQMSRQARLALADDVIDNAGPLSALDIQVALLDAQYRHAALLHAALEPARSSPENGADSRKVGL
ncbi:MAG: dephospho-CoA kinase [Betaproteobacteria bacterium]